MNDLRRGRHKLLLEDSDVKRWYRNLSKGSQVLADNYLRTLGLFLELKKLTPKEFIRKRRKDLEDLTQDFVNDLEEQKNPDGTRKYSPGYAAQFLKAIRSWAQFNDKPIRRKIKISNATQRPTIENERVVTIPELRKLLYSDTTKLRERASIILMAHSGLRIETLGNYRGTDGLKLKDFPELEYDKNKASFTTSPTLLKVRPELSKTKKSYLTFISTEGIEVLTEWLNKRLSDGEELGPDTPVIGTTRLQDRRRRNLGTADSSPHISAVKVGDNIRKSMRAVGIVVRPYSLRAFFDTQLLLAESKGLIAHDYRIFWMAHVGTIDAQYTTNKGRLPDDLIGDMRESYSRAEVYLRTNTSPGSDDVQKSFLLKLLEELDISEKTTDINQVIEKLRNFVSSDNGSNANDTVTTNGSGRKFIEIPETELCGYLNQGAELVKELSNDRCIVRLP